MKIISYNSCNDVVVEFQDKHRCQVHSTYSNFKKGNIKNPYDISVFGKGYYGNGKHRAKIDGELTRPYIIWKSMMDRCYAEKRKTKFKAYFEICDVCDEWLCFQNFADWYEDNQYSLDECIHLDKDILVSGNKTYSPDTCLMIPQRINMLFMNISNNRGLPNGIVKVSKRYYAKYNSEPIGSSLDFYEAYRIYAKAKKENIIRIANEYKSKIPIRVYDALLAYEVKLENDKNYKPQGGGC